MECDRILISFVAFWTLYNPWTVLVSLYPHTRRAYQRAIHHFLVYLARKEIHPLEVKAREATQKRFRRGAVTLNLQLQREASAASVRVNADQLAAAIAAARPFLEPGVVEPARLDGLLALRGVMELEDSEDDDDQAALGEALLESLTTALDQLAAARRAEGEALAPLVDRKMTLPGVRLFGSISLLKATVITDPRSMSLAPETGLVDTTSGRSSVVKLKVKSVPRGLPPASSAVSETVTV